MKILDIWFKNFASYGNTIQHIHFDKDQADLHLVLGRNGAGKTSIANVIKFLLYGKVDGVTLSDLPNRVNKNMWGRINIQCKNKLISIERGLKPALFKVFINNVEYDQAGKTNVQETLETEYYDIPYNVFKNIIILSVNDFKSFLTMTPGDKRNIIDKLFGFSIINDMSETIKKERKLVLNEINICDRELTIITNNIQSINTKINAIKTDEESNNQKKIQEIKDKLIALHENLKRLNEAKSKVTDALNKVEVKISEYRTLYAVKTEEYKKVERQVKLYSKNKCPLCESNLETDDHKQHKLEYEEELKKIPAQMEEIKSSINKLKANFDQIRIKQHSVISKVSSVETSIKTLKQEIINISNRNKSNTGIEQLNTLIAEARTSEQTKTKEKNDKASEEYFLDVVEDVIGNGGIKKLAMQTILPTLNANIADMIQQIEIPFVVKFDDKFDCKITSLGETVSPKTLSTGERKKIDFIIIIAMIKLLKLRYPGLNVLFLDEIFSSVDAEGVYSIIDILSSTIKEIDVNTFVINHTVLPSELFDKKIDIVKDSNFSKLSIEDIK